MVEIAGFPIKFDFSVEVDLGGEQQFSLGYGPNPEGLLWQVWIAVDHSDGPARSNGGGPRPSVCLRKLFDVSQFLQGFQVSGVDFQRKRCSGT